MVRACPPARGLLADVGIGQRGEGISVDSGGGCDRQRGNSTRLRTRAPRTQLRSGVALVFVVLVVVFVDFVNFLVHAVGVLRVRELVFGCDHHLRLGLLLDVVHCKKRKTLSLLCCTSCMCRNITRWHLTVFLYLCLIHRHRHSQFETFLHVRLRLHMFRQVSCKMMKQV